MAMAVRDRLGNEPEDEPLLNRLVDGLGRGRVNQAIGPKVNLMQLIAEMDQRALDDLRVLAGRFDPPNDGQDEPLPCPTRSPGKLTASQELAGPTIHPSCPRISILSASALVHVQSQVSASPCFVWTES
jgi:hypothetical protein